MDLYHSAVGVLRTCMLLVGSAVIFIGVVRGVLEVRGTGSGARVAREIATHASLGLEFFVGGTILNLLLRPTWAAVATMALTIAVRKLITLSLGRSVRAG